MVLTLLENHQTIRFLSTTGPDPLENNKATKPANNVESTAAWDDDGPLKVVF